MSLTIVLTMSSTDYRLFLKHHPVHGVCREELFSAVYCYCVPINGLLSVTFSQCRVDDKTQRKDTGGFYCTKSPLVFVLGIAVKSEVA